MDQQPDHNFLYPIFVPKPFQLLGMDYIGPLPESATGSKYILHIIDYFSRFSMAFSDKAAASTDTITGLRKVFYRYVLPLHHDTQRPRFEKVERTHFGFKNESSSNWIAGEGFEYIVDENKMSI